MTAGMKWSTANKMTALRRYFEREGGLPQFPKVRPSTFREDKFREPEPMPEPASWKQKSKQADP